MRDYMLHDVGIYTKDKLSRKRAIKMAKLLRTKGKNSTTLKSKMKVDI